MGSWDHREKSAHTWDHDPSAGQNPHILAWWTPAHDELLATHIAEWQWAWAELLRYFSVDRQLLAMTPDHLLDAWKATDPHILNDFRVRSLDKTHYLRNEPAEWRSIIDNAASRALGEFMRSYATVSGMAASISLPQRRNCPLCGYDFLEDSVPGSAVRHLGIEQVDFCAPCLRDVLFSPGNGAASREDILCYIRDLTASLQVIPSERFGDSTYNFDVRGLTTDERASVLNILKRRPSLQRIFQVFGWWSNALVAAGVLELTARQPSLGTRCLAIDGHVCVSIGEKNIDDMLHALAIQHDRDVVYPEWKLTADFVVDGVFIEYFGLAGQKGYDKKTEMKRQLCRRYEIPLIEVYASDMRNGGRLRAKLLAGLSRKKQSARDDSLVGDSSPPRPPAT
jgi:hypothetical protein